MAQAAQGIALGLQGPTGSGRRTSRSTEATAHLAPASCTPQECSCSQEVRAPTRTKWAKGLPQLPTKT